MLMLCYALDDAQRYRQHTPRPPSLSVIPSSDVRTPFFCNSSRTRVTANHGGKAKEGEVVAVFE